MLVCAINCSVPPLSSAQILELLAVVIPVPASLAAKATPHSVSYRAAATLEEAAAVKRNRPGADCHQVKGK